MKLYDKILNAIYSLLRKHLLYRGQDLSNEEYLCGHCRRLVLFRILFCSRRCYNLGTGD